MVKTGHTVTIASTLNPVGGIKVDGGSLVINADVYFDDSSDSGVGLTITATNSGGVTSNATASAPRILQSVSTSPTNKWSVLCYDIAVGTVDARTLTFDFIEFINNMLFIGNDTYVINFNGSTATSPFITHVGELVRDARVVQNIIPGRATGRVHVESESAGTVTIKGVIWKSAWTSTTIRNMMASFQRISFFGDHTHLPSCRVERFSPGERQGLWYPFSMTIIEDK